MNQVTDAQQQLQASSEQSPNSQDTYLNWQIDIQSAAAQILERIIGDNNGEIPFNCAANIILECYRTLDIPQGAMIAKGTFTGWTDESGLCEYPNHVWLRANSSTIIDPLADRFRKDHIPVEPMSYEVEKILSLKDLCELDSFCDGLDTDCQ